jgi:predicted transcriptional regulator of viral defense system
VKKALDKIKHGTKIVNAMPEEELFFVEDIKRVTGLDDKTLRQVVNSLLKNGYVHKNEHGMLYREYEAA